MGIALMALKWHSDGVLASKHSGAWRMKHETNWPPNDISGYKKFLSMSHWSTELASRKQKINPILYIPKVKYPAVTALNPTTNHPVLITC